MADPKIKYDIEAAVKGEADAQQLADALRNVGDVLDGDLKQAADEAAKALDNLGSKQRAQENFSKLRIGVQQLDNEFTQAVATVDRLGNELEATAAKTQATVAAENAARTAVAAAQAELERKRVALRAVRDENTGAARRTDEYRAAVDGLKTSIAQSAQDLKALEAAQRDASRATATAQNAEAALRKEYEVSIGSATRVSAALRSKNAALSASRDTMQALGLSTTNLAQQEANLQAAVAQVRQEVAAMAPAYQQAAAASSQSTQVQAQNQRTLREGMTSISTQLQRIQTIAGYAVGGSYFTGLAYDLAQTADAFRNLEARVKLATGEGPLFQQSFQGVQRVALATNSALDETGTLFARLTKAAEESGASAAAAQQRALGLTETINQSIQLSGGSAEAAKAAITQLIQGLQSGVLRGEEFNSVMEQAPRLAQALAQGLGVTTGELRKLAEQGALTSETVMKALEGQADAVAAEFSKLPPTVGRALQNLSSQWTLYVGESDKGLISSANAAKVIDALAKNLDLVVSTLTAAGKAWAAIKIAGLVGDFTRWATSTLTATAAVEANTVATTANTVAARANATAQAQAAAAQAAGTAATTANTAAKAANATAWAEVGAFTRAAGAAQATATTAITANTAAVAANTAGAARAGIVWRGASALFGPWGIAVAALTPEILGLSRALGEQMAKWAGWGKVLEDNERKVRQLEEAHKANAEALARQNRLYEEARNKTFELSKEAAGLIAQFDKLRKDGDSVADAISKIGKDFDLSNIPGIKNAAAVLDKLVADNKLSATEVQAAWAQALAGRDLLQFETMARAAFSGAKREGERTAQMLDAVLREAVNRTGLEFTQLEGRIGAASRSAVNDLEIVIGGMDRLKAQGVDVGRVLNASISRAINTADSQQALDAVRARIEELRKVLGTTVANGLLDQAAAKALELRDALDAAKGGINSVSEAMGVLGLQTTERLQATAKQAQQAYDVIARAGAAEGESFLAWQNRKEAAALVMIQRLIEANRGVVNANIEARASAAGLRVEVDSSGRVVVRSMRDAEEATRRVGDAARSAASGYQAMGQSADDAQKKLKAIYDRHRMGEFKSTVGNSGDIRETGILQTDVNQEIAQRYGEDMVGSKLAQEAYDLRQQLASYRKSYGAMRTPTSQLQERNIAAELARVEALIEKEKNEAQGGTSRTAGGGSSSSSNASSSSGDTGRGAVTRTTIVNFPDSSQYRFDLANDESDRNFQSLMRRIASDRAASGRG